MADLDVSSTPRICGLVRLVLRRTGTYALRGLAYSAQTSGAAPPNVVLAAIDEMLPPAMSTRCYARLGVEQIEELLDHNDRPPRFV